MEDPAIASHAEFVGEENAGIDPDTISAEDNDWRGRNSFRTIQDPERISPLLIAMARAVKHALVLRRIWLFMASPDTRLNPKYLANREELDLRRSFAMNYYGAGVRGHEDNEVFDRARVIWRVGDWRPDEEVMRHWRNAVGPDGLVIFRDVEDTSTEEESEEEFDEDSDDDSIDLYADDEY